MAGGPEGQPGQRTGREEPVVESFRFGTASRRIETALLRPGGASTAQALETNDGTLGRNSDSFSPRA